MGQHKYNPTAIAAKNGEIPQKERPKLTKRQAERLMKLEIVKMLDPFGALPEGMAEIIAGGMPFG